MHAKGDLNLFGTPPGHHQKLDEASVRSVQVERYAALLDFASVARKHEAFARISLAEWSEWHQADRCHRQRPVDLPPWRAERSQWNALRIGRHFCAAVLMG